jgi:hypothetical protein
VARENANNKIIFMVVAFDDNRDRLNFLLSGFDKLYFRPIITSPSSIKSAAVSLAKFNVGISETPATVYKGLTSANYTIITTDFSTRRELTALIINKN